jgi:hypothetical protein
VFGKQGADPIELSAIATGTGGFVINGEVEVCNKSSKLSFRVLLPEPVISITSMSWMRNTPLITSAIKMTINLRVSIPPPPSTRARLPEPVFSKMTIFLLVPLKMKSLLLVQATIS